MHVQASQFTSKFNGDRTAPRELPLLAEARADELIEVYTDYQVMYERNYWYDSFSDTVVYRGIEPEGSLEIIPTS